MDFIKDEISVIYLFWFSIEAKSTRQGISRIKPLVGKCEDFADSMDILFHADHVGACDGSFSCRFLFNIKAPQYIVLTKVATLFTFAANHKLLFGNQFFLSK